MKLMNLTPHTLNIRVVGGTMIELPASGQLARCQETRQHMTFVDTDPVPAVVVEEGDPDFDRSVEPTTVRPGQPPQAIPLYRVRLGAVEGLPEPDPAPRQTMYIVSRIVAEAVKAAGDPRRDLLIPGPAIRDDQGRIVGCDGLSIL